MIKRPEVLRILKFIGIGLAAIFILFGITSWIVFEKKNDWLLKEIHSYMNESQSGQLEIASIDMKIFSNFPDLTLKLEGINYYEHRDSLRTPGEKPILHADNLYIAVDFMQLLNEKLKVSKVNLTSAQLNIIRYQSGKLNIGLAMAAPVKQTVIKKGTGTKPVPKSPPVQKKAPKQKTTAKPKPAVQIDLNSIIFDDLTINWNTYNKPPSVIYVKEMELELTKDEKQVDIDFSTKSNIKELNINGFSIPSGNLSLHAALRYEKENEHLAIREAEVTYDEFSASIKGSYYHKKKQLLDITIDASSNDLQLLSIIIKPEVLKQNPGILKSGDIYARGRIFGETENRIPQFDISFGMKNLAMQLPKDIGSFKKVGFDGRIISGDREDYSRSSISIRNLSGNLPGGFINGEFSLTNFNHPYLKYNLDAQLKLDGYDQVFKMSAIKNLVGDVSMHADFNGPIKLFSTHEMDSSRSSWLAFHNVSFILTKTNQPVSGLSGKIENRNNLATIQQLTFQYGENDILLNAEVENLMHLLIKKEKDIIASGNLKSDQLYTKDFIFDTLMTADIQDRISKLSFDFKTETVSQDSTSGLSAITFEIKNLSARFDKLADLKNVDTNGTFRKTDNGLTLDLNEFRATLPYGQIDVSGDLQIPEQRLWKFNAKVNATKFPWTYIKDLIAEIKLDAEPVAKNFPVTKMDILSANLDVSADIITYPFDFNKLDIRNSKIHFQSADAKMLSVENLNATFDKLYFIHPENSGALIGLKATHGTMDLGQLKVSGLNPVDIKMNLEGISDTLNIDFYSTSQKAKSENGQLLIDFTKRERAYYLQYQVKGTKLESFIKKYYKKKFMEGSIDYALNFRTHGATMPQIKQNLVGTIEIEGDSLMLYGVDVDKLLTKFKRSQQFNLTDLGAVLVAGPVGLAVTKGTDFVSLATVNLNPSQKTNLKTLYTKWHLENQKLRTEDVAFTTELNRIAINGSVDFANDTIPGLTIAVVDKNGCSLMDQNLYGKTSDLKTGKLNITKTIFGSVINFVNVVVGKDCKPVYNGRVKAPK